MKRLVFLFLIICGFGATSSYAQVVETNRQMVVVGNEAVMQRTVVVDVKDADTGDKMPGAKVDIVVAKGDTLTATSMDGLGSAIFWVKKLEVDSVYVRASYPGYQTLEGRFKSKMNPIYEVKMHSMVAEEPEQPKATRRRKK